MAEENKTNWKSIADQVRERMKSFPYRESGCTHQEYKNMKSLAPDLARKKIAELMNPTTWLAEAEKGNERREILIDEKPGTKKEHEAKEICSSMKKFSENLFKFNYPGFISIYTPGVNTTSKYLTTSIASSNWQCKLTVYPDYLYDEVDDEVDE